MGVQNSIASQQNEKGDCLEGYKKDHLYKILRCSNIFQIMQSEQNLKFPKKKFLIKKMEIYQEQLLGLQKQQDKEFMKNLGIMHHFLVFHLSSPFQEQDEENSCYTKMSSEFSPKGIEIRLGTEKIFEKRNEYSLLKQSEKIGDHINFYSLLTFLVSIGQNQKYNIFHFNCKQFARKIWDYLFEENSRINIKKCQKNLKIEYIIEKNEQIISNKLKIEVKFSKISQQPKLQKSLTIKVEQ